MLIPIFLSLFWGICSTILIQPWFWKNIKRKGFKLKSLIGDVEQRGFSEKSDELKYSIILQVIYFCLTFVISLLIYLPLSTRYNFYGAIAQILFILLFQGLTILDGWNNNKELKVAFLICIAIICIGISITDAVMSSGNIIGIKKDDQKTEIVISTKTGDKINLETGQPIIPSSTIEELFEAYYVSEPISSNGKYLYTINSTSNGKGVVIVDKTNSETAKFIKCNFKCDMSLKLRNKYPFSRIKILNVVISDDEVPFGKYAILKNKNFWEIPVLDKYVLQNMLTGEFTEYPKDELPKFADN